MLAIPLLTGDVDMTAVGTCTEVIDGNVFGFGHPFMSQGSVSLPVGPGYINAVIANLMTSFKLGAMTEASGGIYADELTGVAGSIGKVPTRIPIDVQVKYTDGSLDESYHFLAASHPRFTPILAITAISSAITGEHELPEFHTMQYDLKTTYENGRVLEMNNVSVNSDVGELFFELGGPMMAAAENPFERSARQIHQRHDHRSAGGARSAHLVRQRPPLEASPRRDRQRICELPAIPR